MNNKKQVRSNFRNSVFKRDNYSCRICLFKSTKENAEEDLDAHHVTDRNLLPKGGYVKENGISLCPACHILAEVFHSTGTAHPGFSPEDLYKVIGSCYDKALAASEKLR